LPLSPQAAKPRTAIRTNAMREHLRAGFVMGLKFLLGVWRSL
jgi:hypothetical protein